MKHYLSICLTVLAVFTTVSCSEKKNTGDIIAVKPVEKVPDGPRKMGDNAQERTIEWGGNTYRISVSRHADGSLPRVEDESHRPYFDNKITLMIIRSDGSKFFDRTFTKADFNSCLNAHFQAHGALLGIVFTRVKGDVLVFAASVGSPDITSDEYMPLTLTLSRTGNMSITRDSQLDSSPTQQENEEDGV